MKNFPHQHTSFSRFRAVLEAIRDLNIRGEDVGDDGVLGRRLAIDTIHRFLGLDYSTTQGLTTTIEHRLAEEELKPRSRQGARTAARENRKTLRHLGWLSPEGVELTIAGEALLSSTQGSVEEMEIIRAAVSQIALSDEDGNISHPVLHLLRLVDTFGFPSRDRMELALEARDDTELEFSRIEQLARSPEFGYHMWEQLGVSRFRVANARKILPVFALKSGLMEVDNRGRYILTGPGRQLLGYRTTSFGVGSVPVSELRYSARNTKTVMTDPGMVGNQRTITAAALYTRSHEEQQAAALLLSERTARHQTLVRTTAMHCGTYSGQRQYYENAASYDLVVDSGADRPIDLVEAKTIDNDGRRQIRRAIGQLFYYEYFVVTSEFPNRTIAKSVVVDRPVDDELSEFLDSLSVGLLVVTPASVVAKNNLGAAIAHRLFSHH